MIIKNPILYIKSIDLIPLKNIGTFLLAKAGNEQAIIEMAIQYLVENNDEKASIYVNNIEENNLRDKFPILADYYDFCLDYHFRYSYDKSFLFKEYALNRWQYRHQWYVTKRAIKDKLIHKYDIITALELTTINDDDSNDFIRYLFKIITNKYHLFRILLQKINLLKDALSYGYQNKCLNLENLIDISLGNENIAKSIVSMMQINIFSNIVNNKKLLNWIYDLGDSFAAIRYECGLLCLQLGATEKAKILLSNINSTSPSYEHAIKMTAHTSNHNQPIGDFTSEKAINIDSISFASFNKVHKDYLSKLGFFSYQSSDTNEAINKASQADITDYERYRILKQYVDSKNNLGRRFRACLLSHFYAQFKDCDARNDANVKPYYHMKL